jgi:ABC-type nitrate/sulfonate/bicarbonate transport system permease component
VIAIIWFKGLEFRIFFIMVMTTLPGFAFMVLDAYRAMSKDLFEITLAFRPSRYNLFRTMIWPTVFPGILTAWKVNLGNASRVVVGSRIASTQPWGVGYQLLVQQQIFDMAGAIADPCARHLRADRAAGDHLHRAARSATAPSPSVRCERASRKFCSSA